MEESDGFSMVHPSVDASWYVCVSRLSAQALSPGAWPGGYTTSLHIAANGSARNPVRDTLMTRLVVAKADVNAKTKNWKANTAATLAAGQGATDVSTLILAAGGDKTVILRMRHFCHREEKNKKMRIATTAPATKQSALSQDAPYVAVVVVIQQWQSTILFQLTDLSLIHI